MEVNIENIRVGDILRCDDTCEEGGNFNQGCVYEVSSLEDDRIYCFDRDDDEEYIVEHENWSFHSRKENSFEKDTEVIEEINTKPNKEEIKVYKKGNIIILTDKDGDSITMSKETFKSLK